MNLSKSWNNEATYFWRRARAYGILLRFDNINREPTMHRVVRVLMIPTPASNNVLHHRYSRATIGH